jgi:hypothetical protein
VVIGERPRKAGARIPAPGSGKADGIRGFSLLLKITMSGGIMNAKKIIIISVAIIALIALALFIADYRGKSILVGELNRQLSSLDRESRERKRDLENNLGELGKLSQDAIASLEGAGKIIERTGSELHAAAANLRDAKGVLGNLAIQIRDLQMELDNCRADLYRIRSLAGVETGGELRPP